MGGLGEGFAKGYGAFQQIGLQREELEQRKKEADLRGKLIDIQMQKIQRELQGSGLMQSLLGMTEQAPREGTPLDLEANPEAAGTMPATEPKFFKGLTGDSRLMASLLAEIGSAPDALGFIGGQLGSKEADFTLSPGQKRFSKGKEVAAVPPESKERGFTLSPGQKRFDDNGQPIAEVAPEIKLDAMQSNAGKMVADTERIFGAGSPQHKAALEYFSGTLTAGGEPPKLSDEAGMRKEFTGLSKDFITVAESYARLRATATTPSSAGDIATVFSFMRMLDPNSTVREGEFATAQNTGGIPDRVWGMYNRLLSGERLTPKQRADFLGQAEALFQAQKKRQLELEGAFGKQAKLAGINPAKIVTDFIGSLRTQSPGKPTDTPTTPPEAESVSIVRRANKIAQDRYGKPYGSLDEATRRKIFEEIRGAR